MISNTYWSFVAQDARHKTVHCTPKRKLIPLIQVSDYHPGSRSTSNKIQLWFAGRHSGRELRGRVWCLLLLRGRVRQDLQCKLDQVVHHLHLPLHPHSLQGITQKHLSAALLGCAILLRAQHCIDITLQITRISKKVPACHSCFCTVP